MRILIVGNGGREHALLWKLKDEHPSGIFYATRPNAGMETGAEAVPIAPGDVEALAGWAAAHSIDLTVVGPEAPLAAGIVDRFRRAGIPIFGPTRDAARIESSKAFAKELMAEASVPTATYRTFSDASACEEWIREEGAPIVVKASGLAAGKGAIVCASADEAVRAARRMLVDLDFGEAGREVVVEEFMEGEELSVFGITDGEEVLLLLPSQDHKRVGEGDTGPNTGGMGAYAPVSLATDALMAAVRRDVFVPTLRALANRGSPFQGLLYAGLMVTDQGVRVVEFNCRFGDPETQAILPLMESSLLELLVAVADGEGLRGRQVRWRDGYALTTVIASGGYPGSYDRGKRISFAASVPESNVFFFHAGTRRDDETGAIVTSGGRVLACTGVGETLEEAAGLSRRGAAAVQFDGAFFRRDLGAREIERLPREEVEGR